MRLSKPQRFSIKPRHYDPIKEEIEQRTERIRRQLQAEGKIKSERESEEVYHSSIKGAFTQANSNWKKDSPLVLEKTGLLRLVILLLILGTLGGYLYIGPEFLYYLLYLALIIGLLVGIFRLRSVYKNE